MIVDFLSSSWPIALCIAFWSALPAFLFGYKRGVVATYKQVNSKMTLMTSAVDRALEDNAAEGSTVGGVAGGGPNEG